MKRLLPMVWIATFAGCIAALHASGTQTLALPSWSTSAWSTG